MWLQQPVINCFHCIFWEVLERVKGIEPSTRSLGSYCSTTELHPPTEGLWLINSGARGQERAGPARRIFRCAGFARVVDEDGEAVEGTARYLSSYAHSAAC